MDDKQEYLDIKKYQKKPEISQRRLSKKFRYESWKIKLLHSIFKKSLIKIQNFKNNPNKLRYVYIITPKGIRNS